MYIGVRDGYIPIACYCPSATWITGKVATFWNTDANRTEYGFEFTYSESKQPVESPSTNVISVWAKVV